MEVYHSGHHEHKWLQMATWKDLSKRINRTKNTIDWINHTGRIVKHMLPVVSAFAPSPSPRRWTPSPRRSTPSPRRSAPSPRRSPPSPSFFEPKCIFCEMYLTCVSSKLYKFITDRNGTIRDWSLEIREITQCRQIWGAAYSQQSFKRFTLSESTLAWVSNVFSGGEKPLASLTPHLLEPFASQPYSELHLAKVRLSALACLKVYCHI